MCYIVTYVINYTHVEVTRYFSLPITLTLNITHLIIDVKLS